MCNVIQICLDAWENHLHYTYGLCLGDSLFNTIVMFDSEVPFNNLFDKRQFLILKSFVS